MGNTPSGSQFAGFALFSSNSNVFLGNTATRNGNGFALFFSNSNALLGNTASGNSQSGLDLVGTNFNALMRNTAEANTDGFRVVSDSKGNVINRESRPLE